MAYSRLAVSVGNTASVWRMNGNTRQSSTDVAAAQPAATQPRQHRRTTL